MTDDLQRKLGPAAIRALLAGEAAVIPLRAMVNGQPKTLSYIAYSGRLESHCSPNEVRLDKATQAASRP